MAELIEHHGLVESIDLGEAGPLGEAYERGNVAAIEYQHVPSGKQIETDLLNLLPGVEALMDIPDDEVVEQPITSYLLVWNPKAFSYSVSEIINSVRQTGSALGQWSSISGAVKPGDKLYLMRVGLAPKGIVAAGVATSTPYKGAHWSNDPEKSAKYVDIRWEEAVDLQSPGPLSLEQLQAIDPDFRWTAQASGIQIPQETAHRLQAAWLAHLQLSGPISTKSLPPYTKEDFLRDTFLPAGEAEELLDMLRLKKNLVLQGPPGVGKSYVGRKLAYALVGSMDDARIEWVQFHQSYTYEEFIQGYRPSSSAGFSLVDGIFKAFCDRARMDSDFDYVFVIDEVNRGNLSKIFGEALSLIEDDKRGGHSVRLAYGHAAERFSVPENVYILGLMNTADRSLALVDFALRRRFRFADISPQFASPAFRTALLNAGLSEPFADRLIRRLTTLNQKIVADRRNLGRGFEIGHSFFSPTGRVADEREWFAKIVKYEVAPLLREYYFDGQEKAAKLVAELVDDSDS